MDRNIRKAQKIMLEIFLEFHRICEKYSLRYWMDTGTLLGAVRHKGFIPWDDDLDVCMPIEDYYTFLEIAPKELPKDMFLQTRESDKHYKRYFAKIRSRRGVIIERFEYRRMKKGKPIKYNMGIYIDIFPCITISKEELRKYRLLSKLTNRIRKIIDFYPLVKFLFDKADFYLHKGWEDENLYVAKSIRWIWMEGRIIPLRSIFPLKKYEFEGYYFYGPRDYDTYLKIQFGNYMKLPPPTERKSHSAKIIIYR